MLQIRRKQNNAESSESTIWGNGCELLVDGTYIGEAKVSGSSPKLEIDIEDFEVSKQIITYSFCQIFEEVQLLVLEYPYN